VGFTRDPRTGERRFYAEFLPNAQGEDVVAGIRTPLGIEELHARMPQVYDELLGIADRLERHYKDMQDLEFTIQEGTLYLLQTRSGKRSARAAVQVAVDLVREHVIDRDTALLRVNPRDLGRMLVPMIKPEAKDAALTAGRLLARGLPASPVDDRHVKPPQSWFPSHSGLGDARDAFEGAIRAYASDEAMLTSYRGGDDWRTPGRPTRALRRASWRTDEIALTTHSKRIGQAKNKPAEVAMQVISACCINNLRRGNRLS
jgi:hypothetical protein